MMLASCQVVCSENSYFSLSPPLSASLLLPRSHSVTLFLAARSSLWRPRTYARTYTRTPDLSDPPTDTELNCHLAELAGCLSKSSPTGCHPAPGRGWWRKGSAGLPGVVGGEGGVVKKESLAASCSDNLHGREKIEFFPGVPVFACRLSLALASVHVPMYVHTCCE